MDKNILAEYQKRVEDMLVTLEKYQTIIDEGIEESQRRTDTRLAELQARREELEQPVDMSDVSATVIDRRSTIDREYSDDREGYLLSEYDKRRLDGYDGPKYAEIVDEIRTIRENRRLEQKEAVEAEMQDLIAKQADIDNARDAEEEKASLIMQLQEEKDKIEANIQSKKENIEQEMAKFDKAYKEAVVHGQALTLYKDPSSKVYTAAKTELERCTKQAETAQTKVKRLIRKISHLEQDLAQVDKLLDSLSNSREMDEIAKQEDGMWAEYRAEQEARRDKEVDEGLEAKRLEEEQEEARIAEETAKEVEGYADGLNPEEPIEPEHSEGTTSPNPVQQTAEQGTQSSQQIPKPEKKEAWKVTSVTLTFHDGNKPLYKAIISNGKEEKVTYGAEIIVLDKALDSDEIKQLTESKGIHKAEKCYDKALAMLLERVDEQFGTKALAEYQMLLANREMIYRYPERYVDCMSIGYDFSGLTKKATKDMKKLQKIAQECEGKGVADYQKRPNIFQRIWKSLTKQTRLLKETALQPNASQEELRKVSLKESMEEGLEDRPYELDIDNLKDYPEFDPEVAHEQLEGRTESLEELVHLDEMIDAAKKWRKAQQIETSTIDAEELKKADEKEHKKDEPEIE